MIETWLRPYPSGQRVPVHARHGDIEQQKVGSVLACSLQTFRTVIGRTAVEPPQSQEHAQGVCGVPVVIHDEDVENPPGRL